MYRNSHPEIFCKKVFLENLQNSPVPSVFFNKVANLRSGAFLKKILRQGAFKNMFLTEHHRATPSRCNPPLKNSLVSLNFKKEILSTVNLSFHVKIVFEHTFCGILIFSSQNIILMFFEI